MLAFSYGGWFELLKNTSQREQSGKMRRRTDKKEEKRRSLSDDGQLSRFTKRPAVRLPNELLYHLILLT